MNAIAARKHVLVGKPFTLSAAEAKEMVSAAERQGVVVIEAFMDRFHPRTQCIRQAVCHPNGIDISVVGNLGVRCDAIASIEAGFISAPADEYQQMIAYFSAVVWEDKTSLMPPSDSIANMRVIDALAEATHSGKTIYL